MKEKNMPTVAQLEAEHFSRAADFYERAPTGQYDEEAAHALRCHHELLEALQRIAAMSHEEKFAALDMKAAARAAIAKVEGGAA